LLRAGNKPPRLIEDPVFGQLCFEGKTQELAICNEGCSIVEAILDAERQSNRSYKALRLGQEKQKGLPGFFADPWMPEKVPTFVTGEDQFR
jgi:hypothetical protein